jgi:hypothetical protein
VAFLGVEPRDVGAALAEGLCDLEGGSLRMKVSVTRDAGRAPFQLYPGICLTTDENTENLSQDSPVATGLTTRCADLAVFSGTASAGLLHVSSPRLPGRLQSALGLHRCLPSCRTKGFPASADFEPKLSVGALMWTVKNAIPKSS